jgi:hypothetical protein
MSRSSRLPPEKRAPSVRVTRVIIAAMIGAGFALTVRVFYPGLMTYDARYVHGAITSGKLGDWQSPVMTWLWALIDPIAPGSGSMFLFIAALYWLGFAILALAVARPSPRLALIVPLIALTPPAFVLIGVIWRDMLFGSAWLVAAALAYAGAGRRPAVRAPLQFAALVLFAIGVLLRPNCLFAAPILLVYLVWPARFSLKRAAIAYVPAAIALYAMIPLVYYGMLGAERQNPLHSVFVYDLGGITYFSGENAFPTTWTPAQSRLLTTACYSPLMWDVYWYREPCPFVMERIEKQEHLFGTPALVRAWLAAIRNHPVAYLAHRSTVFWTFLTGDNLVVWFYDLDDSSKVVRTDDRVLMAVKTMHDALKPTPLFRMGAWLLLCMAVVVAGWRRRETPAGAFAVAVAGSAAVYVLTYWLVAVAVDFRYGYWAVLAALAGGAVLCAAPPARAASG